MTAISPVSPPPESVGADREAVARVSVTMIGALPPWRGVAPYTQHVVEHVGALDEIDLEFIDFSSLYPSRLYPGGRPQNDGARPSTLLGVHVRRLLAWYNPLSWIWAGVTLRGRVVHAQWWSYVLAPVYVVVLALARLRGRRVVLTLHNVLPHDSSRLQRSLYITVFRLAHHFIVHSERNVEMLTSMYPRAAGRVSVVPHGPNAEPALPGPTKSEARRMLGLGTDEPVLLALGNIRPYKGLDVLLHAFRRVLDEGQRACLVVAGQPWGDFEPYRILIRKLALGDHVRTHLEFIPDERMAAFFAAADVAVYPYSQFEAQSGAAIDALAHGVPVIVSDVGGLPDLVDDPRAVVPPNDPEVLARALTLVLTDGALRAKLMRGATRKAAELDWRMVARRTASLYAYVVDSEVSAGR